MTTAIFVRDGIEYQGCAKLNFETRKWFVWILLDSKWYATVGEFDNIFECWAAVRSMLGIGDTRIQ